MKTSKVTFWPCRKHRDSFEDEHALIGLVHKLVPELCQASPWFARQPFVEHGRAIAQHIPCFHGHSELHRPIKAAKESPGLLALL